MGSTRRRHCFSSRQQHSFKVRYGVPDLTYRIRTTTMAIEVPAGFVMNGVAAGIKKTGKEDFTLIHCPGGATAAGVYTQNLVFAAPVGFDRARTPSANIRVIAVNSGNANACTGERGMNDCREMARLASAACG